MPRYVPNRLSAAPVAVTNGFVVSVAMFNGAYTLAANSPTSGARHVTLVRTVVGAADTPGVITITGTDLGGNTITETMIPGNTGVSVTSNTGDDTIIFGWDALCAVATGSGVMKGFFLTVTHASTVTFTDATGTLVVLPASFAVGFYETEMAYSGFLRCETGGTQDIVILHSSSGTF